MLLEIIKKLFLEYRKKYGSPRIFRELKAQAHRVGEKRVARIMRENGLKSTYSRPRKPQTTLSKHDNPISPNLLQQNFDVEKPDMVWVSDITYIPSAEGWLYLCIVKDLCTREIVGYSLERHMRADMVVAALKRAVMRRRPREGLIFHSDRGSQYASNTFRAALTRFALRQSMSGRGNCYDNACAESFFGSFKCELVHDNYFKTFEEAQKMIFSYIEIFYNRQRRMACLGNLSPANYAAKRAA